MHLIMSNIDSVDTGKIIIIELHLQFTQQDTMLNAANLFYANLNEILLRF